MEEENNTVSLETAIHVSLCCPKYDTEGNEIKWTKEDYKRAFDTAPKPK